MNSSWPFPATPITQSRTDTLNSCVFGSVIDVKNDERSFLDEIKSQPDRLSELLNAASGLLIIKGLHSIVTQPKRLVTLSHLFGREVENYASTLTPRHMIHESHPEILVISNQLPYDRQPPAQPHPPMKSDGTLPVQFPHRNGWHTDQSFRRPPPDISLFYGVTVTPHGQGQTLFADGVSAYADLSDSMKQRISNLTGLHALLGTGRSEQAVRDREPPKFLEPHQQSQRQPLVRIHPVTRRPALYLCEKGQMDWLDGPVVELEPGPDGEGAALVRELMTHFTSERYVYVHEWDQADLVIYDNRCLIHSATWYDATRHDRLMWRTTVHGNPGEEYANEEKSWIPASDTDLLKGLDDARWDYKNPKHR